MQHPDASPGYPQLLACPPSHDLNSALSLLAEHLLERRIAGDGDAFPHLHGRKVSNNRASATDVVGVAVRERYGVKPTHPASPECGR